MEDLKIKDLIENVKILEVKPDQTLCVTLAKLCGAREVKGLGDYLKEQLGCNVIIMAPGTELTVLDIVDGEDNSN